MNSGRWRARGNNGIRRAAGGYGVSAGLCRAVIAGLVVIFMSSAWASEKSDVLKFNDAIKRGDIVVHGRVKRANAKWVADERGRHIYTYAKMDCAEYLKGTGDKEITVEFPGGSVAGITEYVTYSPSAEIGDEMIISLVKAPNGFRPAAGTFGRFDIKKGKAYGVTGVTTPAEIKSRIINISGKRGIDTDNSWLKTTEVNVVGMETAPDFISADSIYGNIVTTSYWCAPGLDAELLDFGTSVGGTVTGFTIGYATTLADPGIITVLFYSGTTSSTRGTLIAGFNIIGLGGSPNPGIAYGFTATVTLNSSQQFDLPGGDFGYSYQFYNTQTGVWLSSGGAGNIDGLWLDSTYYDSPWGGDPFGGFYMAIEAAPAGTVPSIISISPGSASAGTGSVVTITGSNFGATQGSGTVNFFYRSGQPTIPAPVSSWSDTSITCVVPVGMVGDYPASSSSGPVKITNDAGVTGGGYNFIVPFGYGQAKWPETPPVVQYWVNDNCGDCTGGGAAVQAAADSWNGAGAQFSFQYAGSHTDVVSSYDSKNEIMWGATPSGTIAVTYYWIDEETETLVECDTVLNDTDFSWDTSGSPTSSQMDVQTITVHEIGHWLNLRDIYGNIGDGFNDYGKIMYGFGSYGQVKRNLSTADRDGIIWIYGRRTVCISGYVFDSNGNTPIEGVLMSADNSDINTVTDANGFYELCVDYGWSGRITPAKYAYAFEPNGRYYTDVNQDYVTGQDYTGILLTFRIIGRIQNECNVPIEGVAVDADNGGGSAVTDANGFYEVWVGYGWSGAVTPGRKHYTFEPNWISYFDVLADLPDQNYVAFNIYDLDCDGAIGLGDLAVLAEVWLNAGPGIASDLNADEKVDFIDFAEFGAAWLDK